MVMLVQNHPPITMQDAITAASIQAGAEPVLLD